MKKQYKEPEWELVRFRFDTAVMNGLTRHSVTEYSGRGGVLGDDVGDDFVIEPDPDP